MNTAKTPTHSVGEQPFDLRREKDLAEIILASRDMMYVLQLLHDFPPGEQDDPKSILASVGVITAYCRPFTRNNRGRVVGAKWIVGFDQDEMALHIKALELRDKDLAHTDVYSGRVAIQIQEVREPQPGGKITYSTRAGVRGFTRPEIRALFGMVSKIREQIRIDEERIAEAVLADRVRAGYTGEFVLGEVENGHRAVPYQQGSHQ